MTKDYNKEERLKELSELEYEVTQNAGTERPLLVNMTTSTSKVFTWIS